MPQNKISDFNHSPVPELAEGIKRVERVEILSQSGLPCALENPWSGKRVSLSHNGKSTVQLSGNIQKFNTKRKILLKLYH